MAIGALLPWVTVAGFLSITGVTARWGLVTLVAGLLTIGIVFQLGTGRLVKASFNKPLRFTAVALGLISLAIALYVGFAIRDALAEDKSNEKASTSSTTGDSEFDKSLDNWAKSFADALKPSTGAGVYATGLGGALAMAGAMMTLSRRKTEVGTT
jgi:hypothetical protein